VNPVRWLLSLHETLALTRATLKSSTELAAALTQLANTKRSRPWVRVWCGIEGEEQRDERINRFADSQAAWLRAGDSTHFDFHNNVRPRRLQLAVSNAEIETVVLGTIQLTRVMPAHDAGASTFVSVVPGEYWQLGVRVQVRLRLPETPRGES
jgi:hypothetical protein